MYKDFPTAFHKVAGVVYNVNADNGFWDEDRNVGEMLALIISEVCEGLEGYRKGNVADDHLPQYDSLTVELADTVIRIMDMSEGLGLPIGDAIMEKIEYNKSRGYKHGKRF